MDGTSAEECVECGFDGRSWRVRDAATLLDALGLWWRLATAGIGAGDLNARPAPTVWSALEYGIHSALVTAVLGEAIGRILATDGVTLPAPPELGGNDEPATLDPDTVLAALEREGHALARRAAAATPGTWTHLGHPPGGTVQAEALLIHAVHDATHHLMDVGRGLVLIGAGTPPGEGRVDFVNSSDGGVPKTHVDGAHIGAHGLTGDRQADRKHHGRPFQAVCLWSTEVIAELVAAGHPIGPGCAGENLTLSGVDWSSLRPGARLRIGSALLEISFTAIPCAKQTQWFTDGDFARIAHERNPQWVRWYAWVREPGAVRPGDAVIIQPRPATAATRS